MLWFRCHTAKPCVMSPRTHIEAQGGFVMITNDRKVYSRDKNLHLIKNDMILWLNCYRILRIIKFEVRNIIRQVCVCAEVRALCLEPANPRSIAAHGQRQ